ncbi:MAG: hypothetical protein ACLQVD_14930 [Capsulimonadaceae bacterium]
MEASRNGRNATPASGYQAQSAPAPSVSPSLLPCIMSLISQANSLEIAARRLEDTYTGKSLAVIEILQAMVVPDALPLPPEGVAAAAPGPPLAVSPFLSKIDGTERRAYTAEELGAYKIREAEIETPGPTVIDPPAAGTTPMSNCESSGGSVDIDRNLAQPSNQQIDSPDRGNGMSITLSGLATTADPGADDVDGPKLRGAFTPAGNDFDTSISGFPLLPTSGSGFTNGHRKNGSNGHHNNGGGGAYALAGTLTAPNGIATVTINGRNGTLALRSVPAPVRSWLDDMSSLDTLPGRAATAVLDPPALDLSIHCESPILVDVAVEHDCPNIDPALDTVDVTAGCAGPEIVDTVSDCSGLTAIDNPVETVSPTIVDSAVECLTPVAVADPETHLDNVATTEMPDREPASETFDDVMARLTEHYRGRLRTVHEAPTVETVEPDVPEPAQPVATYRKAVANYIVFSGGAVEIPKVPPYVWTPAEPTDSDLSEHDDPFNSWFNCSGNRYQLALDLGD